MDQLKQKVEDYVKLNSENYNRNLTEIEVNKITESYLKKNKNYEEETIDAHIEAVKLKWADEERAVKGIDDLKNWRSLRRASVISGCTVIDDVNDLKLVQKSKEAFDFILNVLETNYTVTFVSMNPRQKRKLVETMYPQFVSAGTYFIKEGESDNRMYIVEYGKFLVQLNDKTKTIVERGQFFGEIALLHNVARTADVLSVEDSKIWVVEQKAYMTIRQSDRTKYKNIVLKGLKRTKLFEDFQYTELKAISRVLLFNYLLEGTKVMVKDDEIFLFTRNGKIIDSDGVIKDIKKCDVVTSPFECKSIIEGARIKKKQPRKEDFHIPSA